MAPFLAAIHWSHVPYSNIWCTDHSEASARWTCRSTHRRRSGVRPGPRSARTTAPRPARSRSRCWTAAASARCAGAEDNGYTAGVICAKVARYAERIHHPDRLTQPLLRTGPKGSGQFREIGWDEALDRVAGAFTDATAAHGPEAVWPYYFAGTMGLVQRDGINRLRHVMRYSRQHNTICSTIAEVGWIAGRRPHPRPRPARDGGRRPDRHLGRQPGRHPGQRDDPRHARQEGRAAPSSCVIDPYRTGTAAAADMHLALRPGTDGALACAVMHVAFRDGYADRALHGQYADCPEALEAHLAVRGPEWAAAITGLPVDEIEAFARALLHDAAQLHPRRLRLHPHRATAPPTCTPSPACRRCTGHWRHEGGGAFWNSRAHLSLGQDADRRAGRARSGDPRARHEPHRRRADRRSGRGSATGPRCTPC